MYEQFISGITIKSKEDINKCDECYDIKVKKLGNIEHYIEEISYRITDLNENIYDFDDELEDKEICTFCENKIKFFYNPKIILEKYV